MSDMKIDARMVLIFVVFSLLVILPNCVTKTEVETPPNVITSQPILVKETHTDRNLTLFVTITKPLHSLVKAILIQPDGDEVNSGLISYNREWVGSEAITIDGLFDGNNVVILTNLDNESEKFYQTNWTVRLPHYKSNEAVSRNGLDITFKPYQITSTSDPKKKRVEIPIEGKNTISIKEKEAGVCALRLKVDKGYFYEPNPFEDFIIFRLEPEEKDEGKFIFDIPKDLEPMEMHGYFSLNCAPANIKDVFVLELKK